MPRNASRSRTRARRARVRRKFGIGLGVLALLLGLVFAPTSRTDQSNVEGGPQASVDVLDLMTGISTPTEPSSGNSGPSHAINPFSAPSTGSDGLVALAIENDAIDAVVSTQPHVPADVFGLGLEMPLILALGQFEDSNLGPTEFNGWHRGGGSSAGFFGGGGSGAGAAAGGSGRIDTTGKGAGGTGEGNGPGGNGPDTPGNNDFTFLPDEILTGSSDRGVSPFPVADGLTILSIDSDEGLLPDEETGPLALEENLDLVPNPEPASLILLGSGLVVAASRLRRRNR